MRGQGTVGACGLAAGLAATLGAFAAPPPLVLQPVLSGLTAPVAVTHAGDGSHRLFVAQRDGRILVVQPGQRRGELFVDLSDRISCCEQELGLLGLAFHPRYATNGWFFVNYTDPEGDSVISRLSVSADPDQADPDSAIEILKIEQPGPFHNSAHLAFGPDGYLYVGVGDGASDGDRADNAQNRSSLLGKILRLDVDAPRAYAVPADNPLVGVAEARSEIWALGLRNPWRFGFDRETGDLYIGDVGQNRWEEINFQSAESPGGANYGWRRKEASDCFEPPEACEQEGLTDPIFAYRHDPEAESCGGSVIGGLPYRGPRAPTLTGLYVFADFCTREIWGARRNSSGNWRFQPLITTDARIVSFGEDERGRLLAATLGRRVYRLAGRPLFRSAFDDPRLRDWSRRRGRPRAEPATNGGDSALTLSLDGTPRRVFVRSREPDQESYLRVAFDLTIGRAELGGQGLEILRVSGERALASLHLEQSRDGYAVRLVAADHDGERHLVGVVALPGSETVRLEIRWMRATAADVADGEAMLLKNDRVRALRNDLDNHELTVDSVLLGLPSGARQAGPGTLRIDNYISSR